ncbi:MAG: HAD family hydrolase [Acidobacteria bacterium]|nr:MAG: HAD family hydrolase [Acidobacteriota bacterium]
MVRALLFDFNGVLVDDEPIHLELFQKVLAEEGVSLERDDYFAHYLGFDDRGCFQAVLERAGRPATPEQISRLIARKATYYQERIREQGFPAFPGAVRLVRQAHQAGLMLGVVSGALRSEVLGALEKLGLEGLFKAVVAAEDVRASKPSPEGYRKGLEQLNSLPPLPSRLIHPHEVLAIEDAPAGLEAAAGAGLATLGVAHTYPAAALSAADRVVESLAEVELSDLLGPRSAAVD